MIEPYDRPEWEAWLQEQHRAAGVKSGNLHLQVSWAALCSGAAVQRGRHLSSVQSDELHLLVLGTPSLAGA